MKIWLLLLFACDCYGKNILRKSIVQVVTTIIPFFSNEVTFDEFQKMWKSVENERQNDTLCFFLPTSEKNFYLCNITDEVIHHVYNSSLYNVSYQDFINEASENLISRCELWKIIRDERYNIVLLTNFDNTVEPNKLIRILDDTRREKCELGELPIKAMLYSLLIFTILATIVATVFHQWRNNKERKLKFKQKFIFAMAMNFDPDETKEYANLSQKMFIDENFVEVKNNIRGKGSSSVVCDAFIHTKAPISEIYKCLETQKYKHCPAVIKIVNNCGGQDQFRNVLKEVTVAIKMKWHKNVCCLLGWSIYLENYSLIYESIDGGDLLSWIRLYSNDRAVVNDMQIPKILWQITAGMEYISALGIVHKDLAARNILLTKNFEVKISDFGLASFCDIDSLYHAPAHQQLPIRWMAVESFGHLFSEASDIWSFGVIIWELLTFGQVPYGKMSNEEIVKFVIDGNRLALPKGTEQPWQMLTHDCWKQNRNHRPTFTAIKMLLNNFLVNKTINYGYCSFREPIKKYIE